MAEAFLCEGFRTPIGRYGGSLSAVRPDDMLGHVIGKVMEAAPGLAPEAIEDVLMGCANQAGEDNRNVGRMSALLAGLPVTAAASTINRLCGSGMNAVGIIADAIKVAREMALVPYANRVTTQRSNRGDRDRGPRADGPAPRPSGPPPRAEGDEDFDERDADVTADESVDGGEAEMATAESAGEVGET